MLTDGGWTLAATPLSQPCHPLLESPDVEQTVPTPRGTPLDDALVELVEAAADLASAPSIGEALERLTATAASQIGARVAVGELQMNGRHFTAATLEGQHEELREQLVPPPAWIIEALADDASVRLPASEVASVRPAGRWQQLGAVLATALRSRRGDTLGTVFLADREAGGAFTVEEQVILEQLGSLAAVTVEKVELAEVHARQEAARFRDDMLAGMSHDMHTPLSVIVGIADSLTEDPDLPRDERLEVYATIARQARRLRSLVNQFIDFSRIEADRPLTLDLQPVDVVEVIDNVVPLFTHQREIIVGADEGLPQALADPERLEQVLVNLISNAVKYSDGPVRVVARGIDPDVVIDVVDEGPGLNDDELTEIFGKFQRGTAASGTRGTGLGLYISRALAEAQGGELHAISAGIGSRFRIRLPMTSSR